MDPSVSQVVGYGLILAGAFAALMTLLWSLCWMAAKADEAAQMEEARRRVVPTRRDR